MVPYSTTCSYSRSPAFGDFIAFSDYHIRLFCILEIPYSTTSSYSRGPEFDDFLTFSSRIRRLLHSLELPYSTSSYSRGPVFDDFFMFSRSRIRRFLCILDVSYATIFSCSGSPVFDLRFKLALLMLTLNTSKPIRYSVCCNSEPLASISFQVNHV
jgi:hypothetical protein